jgi:hypothetical protein
MSAEGAAEPPSAMSASRRLRPVGIEDSLCRNLRHRYPRHFRIKSANTIGANDKIGWIENVSPHKFQYRAIDRALMATEIAAVSDRESQAEVDAVLAETGRDGSSQALAAQGVAARRRPGPAGISRKRCALSERHLCPNPSGECALQAKEPLRLRRAPALGLWLSGRREILATATSAVCASA